MGFFSIIRRNGPTVLAFTGAGCTIGAIIFAITGTFEAKKIINEHKEIINQINISKEDPDVIEEVDSEDKYKKDIKNAYISTGLKLAKVYAPTIILGTGAVVCEFGALNIMNKRNAGLAAAAATLSAGFLDYRKRVADRYGEEVEDEIYNNYTTEEVEETVIDENGKEKKVKKKVRNYAENEPAGLYTYKMDPNNRLWMALTGFEGTDRDNFYCYLRKEEQHWNDVLRGKGRGGVVLLHEITDALLLERTCESTVVGWVNRGAADGYEPEGGDGYISFGFDKDPQSLQEFLEGGEVLYLQFNVDGPVIDYLPSNECANPF